jgi:hypothetical protein
MDLLLLDMPYQVRESTHAQVFEHVAGQFLIVIARVPKQLVGNWFLLCKHRIPSLCNIPGLSQPAPQSQGYSGRLMSG